ncbi:MAG: NAD(P)H-hydrate dehydratase [Candidatus Hodarchaeota archaeon]
MTRVISLLDMQIADLNCESLGIPRTWLMENAGAGLANLVDKIIEEKKFDKIMVASGVGGNGGDGLVAARHLTGRLEVHIVLIGDSNRLKGPTKVNWDAIKNLSFSVKLTEAKTPVEIPPEEEWKNTVIIDALLGTGVKGNLREPIATCVRYINQAREEGAVVISADIPSGINPSTGETADIFVLPDYTVCFHALKPALEHFEFGQTSVHNIGVPPEAEFVAGPGDLIPIKQRKKWIHKGEYGRILIVGGSKNYSGAPGLAAMGAQASGIDLVTILTSKTVAAPIRGYSPNFIVREYEADFFDTNAVQTALQLAQTQADAVLVGPGMGDNPEAITEMEDLINELIKQEIPVVVDADALKISPDLLLQVSILTPHAKEFERIAGRSLPKGDKNIPLRLQAVVETAKGGSAIFLVKGAVDVICSPSRWKINKTGVPQMSVGGTGDVLAGVTTAFLGLTNDPFRAAVASAYINGKAGELALNGKCPFTASHVAQYVHMAIQETQKIIRS